jgi:hypothetical protein
MGGLKGLEWAVCGGKGCMLHAMSVCVRACVCVQWGAGGRDVHKWIGGGPVTECAMGCTCPGCGTTPLSAHPQVAQYGYAAQALR